MGDASQTEPERRAQARAARIAELRSYVVTERLELRPDQNADGIRFERAEDLAGEYGEQYRFLGDARLADMEVVVVPDELWHKGSQPSESAADKGMILIREGYYRDPQKERQDETAWMTHELSHLQQSLDRGLEDYGKAQAAGYPDNPVEEYAFRRQFEFLQTKGVDRGRVTAMLQKEYSPDDFRFLNRILDEVYEK